MEQKQPPKKLVKPLPPKPAPLKPSSVNIAKTEPEKSAETKPQKTKRKNKKKKIIIIFCVVATLVIAGIVAYFVIKNNQDSKKLNTPTIKVEQLFNQTIIQASKIDGAKKYEFEITTPSGEVLPVISSKNYIELGYSSKEAGAFSVKVRALGNSKKATSEYSNAENFENYVQLDAPQIFINNIDQNSETGDSYITNSDTSGDDTITWDIIPNATKYLVRYGVDLETGLIKSEEITPTDSEVVFNLSKIYQKGVGTYQISVIAISDNEFYTNSTYQKIFTIEYSAKQDQANGATYNEQTKELTFNLLNNGNYSNEFDLYVSAQNTSFTYRIYISDCTITQHNQTTTVVANLSHIKELQGLTILNMGIVSIKNSQFSIDSEMAEVTINR